MNENEMLIILIISILLSSITATLIPFLNYLNRLKQKKLEKLLKDYEKLVILQQSKKLIIELRGKNASTNSKEEQDKTDKLINDLLLLGLLGVISNPKKGNNTLTKKEIDIQVENQTKEFEKRIKKLEKRFPATATIDKIANINDAIMATQIETINKRLDQIEEKILTRSDVAVIVTATVCGIITAVAGIIAIIKFVIPLFN